MNCVNCVYCEEISAKKKIEKNFSNWGLSVDLVAFRFFKIVF